MVTIDLTTPPVRAGQLPGRDSPPDRRHAPRAAAAAKAAGNAPLPFDLSEAAGPGALEGRLGRVPRHGRRDGVRRRPGLPARRRGHPAPSRPDHRRRPRRRAGRRDRPARHPDARPRHRRRRRRHPGQGLAPAGRRRGRHAGDCDGIVFELAWFRADQWPGELARVAAIPDDVELRQSVVPDTMEVPFQLVDAIGEALRAGRSDLVPVLMEHHGEGVARRRRRRPSPTPTPPPPSPPSTPRDAAGCACSPPGDRRRHHQRRRRARGCCSPTAGTASPPTRRTPDRG